MKKVVSVIAALVLSFAMGMTCLAASPSNGGALTSGYIVVWDTEEIPQAKKILESQDWLKNLLGDKYKPGTSVVAVFELKGTPGQVEVSIPGVSSGDDIVLIHWKNGLNQAPEMLDVTVGDGKISFYTSSFSPFAVIKIADAGTAPKTGDTATTAAAALLLISAAGIVVLNRKKMA